uniref:Non-structural polyprotein 1AB n=1 Tax=Wuhan japanese halfbeak astrovirus TaxID=2116424 RepID=A0A2P1GNE2_9VIRU|nr:ORF1b [Wuhan japanese halfbeak astrovirus]
MEPDHLSFALRHLHEVYGEYVSGSIPLSFDDLDKPVDTSPGYPWMLWYPDERALLESEPEQYEAMWHELDSDETVRIVWYLFGKNEMVKNEKLAAGDIRVICCAPAPFARCQGRLDHDFNRRFKQAHLLTESAVGFTPFYGGVDKLAQLFVEYSWCVESDFKRFDGTIPAEVLWLVRKFRWDMFLPSHKTHSTYRRFFNVSANLIDKWVLGPDGVVHHVEWGNPSGQMSTTIDNCLVNSFVSAYVISKVYGEIPYQLVVYGDDRLLGMNVQPLPLDEQKVMSEVFGMALPFSKVKVENSLEGLSFCGFSFLKERGRWFPAFEERKLLASLERPAQKLPSVEVYYGKLMSICLLLYKTSWFERLYRRLAELSDELSIWLPPRHWFDLVYMDGGGPKEPWINRLVQNLSDDVAESVRGQVQDLPRRISNRMPPLPR